MQKLERKIIYGVLVGVLVYAGVALYADLDALVASLGAFSWGSFGLALVLVSINYLLRFAKWQIYLLRLKVKVPWFRSLIIFLAGFVMSITPGKVGEVLKSVLLRQSDGVPVAKTAPVVLAERVTDLLALIVLAASGAGTYQYGTTALWVTGVILLGGVTLISFPKAVSWIFDRMEILPAHDKIVPKLREAYESTRLLLSPGLLVFATILSVLSWGLEAVAFYFLILGFDASGSVGEALTLGSATFVYSITTIIGAVSFLPGGLGVTEVGMISVLQLLDLVRSADVASAVTVLARLATLWWAVVCGFVAFLIFQKLPKPAQSEGEE